MKQNLAESLRVGRFIIKGHPVGAFYAHAGELHFNPDRLPMLAICEPKYYATRDHLKNEAKAAGFEISEESTHGNHDRIQCDHLSQ